MFDFPTRNNSNLDFVLTDCKHAYLESKLLPPLARWDPSVIFRRAVDTLPRPKVTKIQFQRKSPATCANFRNDLASATFLNDVKMESNVDDAANLLSYKLRDLFEFHFPLRTVRLRDDDKPWVKPSLKLLINSRDRAYAERKTLKYLRLREAVIVHVRKLKEDYISTVTRSKSTRSTWKAIDGITNRKKKAIHFRC